MHCLTQRALIRIHNISTTDAEASRSTRLTIQTDVIEQETHTEDDLVGVCRVHIACAPQSNKQRLQQLELWAFFERRYIAVYARHGAAESFRIVYSDRKAETDCLPGSVP